MRLIDADALIEFIDAGHLRHPSELCFSELDVVNMLNNAPTAYDVEKVVEELEKYGADRYSEAGECLERHIYLDTAKKIVKAGGMK